ncbi:MAG: hypothetical protein FJZ01_28820 [Candidatus Sericytochromatia bacterium]|nr:hypothetical protein [Candidatus Tanganyikabacteria bacterium]
MEPQAVRAALDARPLLEPYPAPLAVARLNDFLREACALAVPDAMWDELATSETFAGQASALAHLLGATPLGRATAAWLGDLAVPRPPAPAIRRFFELAGPLPGDLVLQNPLRLEEFVRKWAMAWQAEIAGETIEESAAVLARLDYGKLVAELAAAEEGRKKRIGRRG